MKFELNFLPANATDKDIFEEIKRVNSIVGKTILSSRDFNKYSKIHSATLCRRYGSWRATLEKAGIGNKYSGPPEISEKVHSKHSRYLSNEQILEELKRIAMLLGKNEITTNDVDKNSKIIGTKILKSRFGSWRTGVEKAGLRVSRHGIRWTDDEYFENLLSVWTHRGRQPLYREMNLPPSRITIEGYRSRFGGWRKALEAFVERMSKDESYKELKSISCDEAEPAVRQEIKQHSVSVEDRRSIPLGLRYKVLSRDNFKCVRCGKSPATTLGVELHVDHKNPFSKSHKTTLDNLETKCKECNLGKSNRYVE